jgi:hypothetical protein
MRCGAQISIRSPGPPGLAREKAHHCSTSNGRERRLIWLVKLRSRSSAWWNGNDSRNKDHILRIIRDCAGRDVARSPSPCYDKGDCQFGTPLSRATPTY